MEPPRHIVHEGKVLREEINESGFRHLVPTTAAEAVYPGFTDPEKRIPWSLFREVIAFMEWGARELKSEVLVILFVNDDGKWEAWAPPQKLLGMSIERLPEDPEYQKQRKAFAGFDEIGSVHHHMGGGSSPSPQDIKDESARRSGYHLTLGGMGTNQRNFHCRIWSNSIMHIVPLTQCVKPDASIGFDDTNMAVAATYFRFPETFPDYWKKNCKAPAMETRALPFAQTGGLGFASNTAVPRTLVPPGSRKSSKSTATGSRTKPLTATTAIERIAEMFDEAGLVRVASGIEEAVFSAWEVELAKYSYPNLALSVSDIKRDAANVGKKVRDYWFDPDELGEMALTDMEANGLDPSDVQEMSADNDYSLTWELMDRIEEELLLWAEAHEAPAELTVMDFKAEVMRALNKEFGAAEIPGAVRIAILDFAKKAFDSQEKMDRTMFIKSCLFLLETNPCAPLIRKALGPLLDK